MEIKPKGPTARGPADWFTGDVWMDCVLEAQEHSTLNVAAVHFTPGARTAWHSHDGGQNLYVAADEGRPVPRRADRRHRPGRRDAHAVAHDQVGPELRRTAVGRRARHARRAWEMGQLPT